jgi:hypothetical protein
MEVPRFPSENTATVVEIVTHGLGYEWPEVSFDERVAWVGTN